MDARYGPAEQDEYTRGLDIDVTIPLQVLVHNSQLFIPGQRSKVRSLVFYPHYPSFSSFSPFFYFKCRLPHSHFTYTPDAIGTSIGISSHESPASRPSFSTRVLNLSVWLVVLARNLVDSAGITLGGSLPRVLFEQITAVSYHPWMRAPLKCSGPRDPLLHSQLEDH